MESLGTLKQLTHSVDSQSRSRLSVPEAFPCSPLPLHTLVTRRPNCFGFFIRSRYTVATDTMPVEVFLGVLVSSSHKKKNYAQRLKTLQPSSEGQAQFSVRCCSVCVCVCWCVCVRVCVCVCVWVCEHIWRLAQRRGARDLLQQR